MSRKRPRSDDTCTETLTTDSASNHFHARDEEFWLEDGNIILVARDIGFCVYRGLLTKQSEVFRDMFTSASPSTGESHDGCPVVHLSDTPEDLRRLLRVICPVSGGTILYSKPHAGVHSQTRASPGLDFRQVSALTRLAHKYGIATLEAQALSLLRATCYSTFEEYEAGSPPIEMSTVDAIHAVNLARLLDVPKALPFAIYRCCNLGGKVVDGWTHDDGTVEYLSTGDLRRVIDGREALANETIAVVFQLFDGMLAGDCQSHRDCRYALERALSDHGHGGEACHAHPLTKWGRLIESNALDWGLCEPCMVALGHRDKELRRGIFLRLPQILGLEIEGWGE